MAGAFDQFGYDDAGAPPPAAAPASTPSTGNPFDRFGYDDGQPSKPIAAADAAPQRGVVSDIVQSGGAGVVRGSAGLVGMPGSVQDSWNKIWDRVALGAVHKGFDWTGHGPQAGTLERAEFDKGWSDLNDVGGAVAGPQNLPTGADVTKGIEVVGGKLPTPQTRAGEYAETVGEFAPAAIGGPGGLVRKGLETVIPAVASETAGQVAKGTPYEGAARIGAAVIAGAGMAGAEGAYGKVKDYTAPMDRVAPQRPVTLADGSVALDSYGHPITATNNQAALAGGFLESKASDPAAVRANLAGGTQEIVPGSVPTTFQQTGDMGLGQLERGVSAANADRFLQRGADQNAARVDQIHSIQPDGSPVDVANSFRAVRDTMDAEHAQSLAAAQQAAQDASRNIGGVGATPESVGAGLRDPVVAARAAGKDNENKLWDAVDPTKKMVMPAAPIADAAKKVMGDVTASATPQAGEEARIFGVAAKYGDQVPFREVTDLRSSISTAMRAAQQSGDMQSLRRLTMLRGSVENTIDHAVENQSALDQIAVRRGTMAPEDAIGARWQKEADAFLSARRAGTSTVARAGNDGASFAPSVFAGDGTQVPGGGRPGDASRPESVQGQEPAGPPLDADAAARLKAASAATKDRAQVFDSGVIGKVLDRGPGNTFTQSDARVGRTIFHPGPTGGEDLRAYYRAGGTPEAATEAAAASLRDHAGRNDGTFDGLAVHRWMQNHETAINELPPEVRDRFQHSIEAQNAYDEVVATQKARENEMKRSTIAPYLGLTEPSSVTRQVGSIFFGQKNAAEVMGDLARRTANDPAARDGLRRAIVEHIQNKFLGGEAGTSGVPQMKPQRFADFFRANQPVLRKVFSEDEANKLSAVANDLERAQRSINATQLKGRSNSVQDYLLTHPRSPDKSILSNIATQWILAGAGHFLAGPLGAIGGWLGPKTVGAMRDAGITRIDNLVTEAMLNPELARALLSKAPVTKDAGTAATLGLRLRQMNAAALHSRLLPQPADSSP